MCGIGHFLFTFPQQWTTSVVSSTTDVVEDIVTRTPSAIVVGGGIAGLAAALGLTARGWRVEVLEQAPRIGESGSGISLWANGVRAMDALGLGDQVRSAGRIETEGGIRDRKGRWLSRTDTNVLERRYGPLVVIRRSDLFDILAAALPDGVLRTATKVTRVENGSATTVSVTHSMGVSEADVVIGADGIHSAVRRSLWPQGTLPRYAGYTAWRMITTELDFRPESGEIWGRGERFGVVPLADGCAYLFAVANAPAGERHRDGELAQVRARFGRWPAPIPTLLSAVSPEAVLHHDLFELPDLDTFVRRRVALIGDAAHAMTPNLGQGANQALEDAVTLAALLDRHAIDPALGEYDRLRRPRSQAIARRSRRIGMVAQWSAPPATFLRDNAIRLASGRAMLRNLDPVLSWHPPE
ncbi:FAD-dependent oxidoreductase [Nocardia nova]|uniref:FAD-dependent oxidoreductase n=1 Tax=Nocardia nova TaxID=37330 RepID=UPI0021586618|nr:FAD-dependent oxidoreductase [Nocardia nova]